MANFNNRANNNRFRGGKPPFGGDGRSRGQSFPKKSWGGDRPVTFHKATCAECGKMCEVPFRPTTGKPVYCKDCFGEKRGSPRDSYVRSDTPRNNPRRDGAPVYVSKPHAEDSRLDTLNVEISAMNRKLDSAIRTLEGLSRIIGNQGQNDPKTLGDIVKKVAKKTTKKKK